MNTSIVGCNHGDGALSYSGLLSTSEVPYIDFLEGSKDILVVVGKEDACLDRLTLLSDMGRKIHCLC